jgi:signal transduction histidine kinase
MNPRHALELETRHPAESVQARLFAVPALAPLLLGASYLLLALISLYVSRQPGSIATIWYANAVAVAFLLHAPSLRMAGTLWLAVAIACLAANLLWDGDPVLASLFVLPNLLEIGLAAWLLRRAELARANLRSPWALVRLLALGGLLPQTVGATVGAWLLHSQRGFLPENTWLAWFEGSVIGSLSLLVLTCLCLRLSTSQLRAALLDWRFLALLPISLAATLWAMDSTAFAFIYLLLPLLLAAMLLEMVAVCVLTLALSLCVAAAMGSGHFVPPPAQSIWEEGLVYLAFAAALLPAQLLASSVAAMRDSADRLAARTRELEAANERLQQFVHIASHDLREPLNTIAQFGNLLQADLQDDNRQHVRDYLRLMSQASQRMRRLLDDVLIYARLRGESAEPAGTVDLARLMEEVKESLAAALSKSGGSIEIAPLPAVQGHASLLSMVFQNLLSNGLKFMPAGRAPKVSVSARQPPGWLVISVRDNGIGIAVEDQARLFKPFSRLHPRRVYEGTGLGLTLCQQAVHAHGGRIELESSPDAGSCFDVWLPQAPRDDAHRAGD